MSNSNGLLGLTAVANTGSSDAHIWAYKGAGGPTGAAGPTGASGSGGSTGFTGPTGASGSSGVSIITLQAVASGNITYDVAATRAAGTYVLQLAVETPVAGSQAISVFATIPPSTNVVDYSGVEVVPASVGANLLCMNSGAFVHPGGNMRIQIATSGTAWSGTWGLQLVKLA